ncbi:unnamed protein product [Meloidogyne enterolobii]|uniref:Uncharacterized protein n=1 Tax=Meloidogyne enterolobii TaxID=390850 RepID=A0ACB0ZA39_MELEN
MQNLNLLIIFIKFLFVFGMYRGHGGGSSSARSQKSPPPPSPDHQIVASKKVDDIVKEQLMKIVNTNNNTDFHLLNIIKPPFEGYTANYPIVEQNNKYSEAHKYLNDKLNKIQVKIENYKNKPVVIDLVKIFLFLC